MLHPLVAASAALVVISFAAPSIAGGVADLKVQVINAVAPSTGAVKITGEPGRTFQLWFSSIEGPTSLDPGIELLIDPIRQLENGLFISGTLDSNGTATFTYPIGADFDGGLLSFQASSNDPSIQVSNLCRSSYQTANSFRPTLGLPTGLSLLGELFPNADGSLLAIGGAGPVAATYDPCTQDLTPAPALIAPAYSLSTHTLLDDGTVLIAGGIGTDGQPTKEAYIFDPKTGSMLATKTSLAVGRAGAAAVKLANGRVFVVGGFSTINLSDLLGTLNGVLASGETYNPTTGGFTTGTPSDLPKMLEAKALATATLLNNGTVLVAGGLGITPIVPLPYVSFTGFVFNPTTNSFGLPKLFSGGRLFHTATKLQDGRVLLAGGFDADLSGFISTGDPTQITFSAVATTAIYSTSGLGSFSAGPSLVSARAVHTATLLGNGKVLAAGGVTGDLDLGAILSGDFVFPDPLDSTELLTASGAKPGPAMSSARVGASAAVSTMDGRVLMLGGGPLQPELYQP